jgi:hypothetical protein
MTERNETTALAALDLATGAGVAVVGLARRAGAATLRRTPRPAVLLGRAGAETAARLAGDLPTRLRARGAAVRVRAWTLAEQRLLATVRPVLDLVLDQIDLTDLVLQRVDIDRIAERIDIDRILDRIDLTELVLKRVELDTIADDLDVERILNRLDLTGIVLTRVDLDRVAAGLDVDAVIDRVDIIAIAEDVVDGIDLPRIIRESTGSVASESLRGVRTRSIEADQALGHFMERFRPRRRSGPHPEPVAEAPGAD